MDGLGLKSLAIFSFVAKSFGNFLGGEQFALVIWVGLKVSYLSHA